MSFWKTLALFVTIAVAVVVLDLVFYGSIAYLVVQVLKALLHA